MTLLHGLHAAGFRKVVVCHLNHGLRGKAAAKDTRFVARWTQKLGYDFLGSRADVARFASARGISIEEAAREARHLFFAECARRERCRRLLLAHHADDQAETCLFQYLRGAGLAGVAGMRQETEILMDGLRMNVFRPLLNVTRAEILQIAKQMGWTWREDGTNTDDFATRNRIRHRLLPLLERELGRPVRAAITRAAEIFRAEEDYMNAEAEKFPLSERLDARTLRALPLALQRRVIRRWLERFGPPECSFEHVESVRSLLAKPETIHKVNLPRGTHARRTQGKIFIETAE